MENGLRIPPQNIEAEQAILGGILLNNSAMIQVMDLVQPEDFYRESHSIIFKNMAYLFDKSEPIDLITLSEQLRKTEQLEKVGGECYISSLTDVVSTSAAILYHSDIVKKLSLKRQLINQCSIISESCFQNWKEVDEIISDADQAISNISKSIDIGKPFKSMKEGVKAGFKKIEKIAEHGGHITGIATGFKNFDNLTAGLQPSDLIIIAGRPSMGKTAISLNIAENAAKNGKIVAISSLEMSFEQLVVRILGSNARVDSKKIRTGWLKDSDWSKLTISASNLQEYPIYIDDSSNITTIQLKAKYRKLQKEKGLDLIIIDYLQLMTGKGESREREIAEISRNLKALAKELNVPVVCLSQLNRQLENRSNKRPKLSDLRESGAIEQDADVIAFIYRDEVYNHKIEENRNIAEILLEKQRSGPTGHFKLTFLKEYTRFEDYADDFYQESDPYTDRKDLF